MPSMRKTEPGFIELLRLRRIEQEDERGKNLMQEKENTKNEPIPGRMEVLRELPAEIMRSLTKDEVRAFLYEEVWPDSLGEKLKEYLE